MEGRPVDARSSMAYVQQAARVQQAIRGGSIVMKRAVAWKAGMVRNTPAPCRAAIGARGDARCTIAAQASAARPIESAAGSRMAHSLSLNTRVERAMSQAMPGPLL